jgi:hypothetical protein
MKCLVCRKPVNKFAIRTADGALFCVGHMMQASDRNFRWYNGSAIRRHIMRVEARRSEARVTVAELQGFEAA